jgi:hypothetical protein
LYQRSGILTSFEDQQLDESDESAGVHRDGVVINRRNMNKGGLSASNRGKVKRADISIAKFSNTAGQTRPKN